MAGGAGTRAVCRPCRTSRPTPRHPDGRREELMTGKPLNHRRHPARIAIAVVLAAAVFALGLVVRPSPPTLASSVSGDPALIERARPLLTGTRDRVSVAQIDGD